MIVSDSLTPIVSHMKGHAEQQLTDLEGILTHAEQPHF